MRNSHSINLLVLLSFVLILFSCSKAGKNPNPQDDNALKVYEYIKRLGFPESSIVDAGNKFFVQNDMVFRKDESAGTGCKISKYRTVLQ